MKTETCVEGEGWAGGHDLRVGVKGSMKKETHWVPDPRDQPADDLLDVSCTGRFLGGSWETMGLLGSCALSAGLA